MMRLALIFLLLPSLSLATPMPQEVVADNSVKAWLIEDDSVPVVSLSVRITGAGYASDPSDKQGRASIAAALLKEGAGGMDAAAFQSYLNRHALRMGVSAGRDALTIDFQALQEKLPEAFRALNLMLTQPTLADDSFTQVITRRKVEVTLAAQQPGYHASRAMASAIYGDHPYGYVREGTAESLSQLSLEDVRTYLAQHIARAQVSVSVAGMVRAGALQDLLQTGLAGLAEEETASAEFMPIPVMQQEVRHVAFDSPQAVIQFAMPAVPRDDPDFYAAYLLTHIMGGSGLTSILSDELRQKRGLTYGVYSWLDVAEESAHLRGQLATATRTVQEAIETLNATLDGIHASGITQEERDRAVAYVTGAFPLSLDSTANLSAYLQAMQHHQLGLDYLQKRNDYFSAVTLEDINRVAKKLLDPSLRRIVWAGQESADE